MKIKEMIMIYAIELIIKWTTIVAKISERKYAACNLYKYQDKRRWVEEVGHQRERVV